MVTPVCPPDVVAVVAARANHIEGKLGGIPAGGYGLDHRFLVPGSDPSSEYPASGDQETTTCAKHVHAFQIPQPDVPQKSRLKQRQQTPL